MPKVRIEEIADLANVSIGTVDRALHGRKGISEKTRRRVLKIASELGYKPNLAARALSVGQAVLRIGICIPREIHFFYDQLRSGMLTEAARYNPLGVEVLYQPVERLGEGEDERVRELIASGVRALLITPGNPQRLAPLIEEAERNGVRVICVASDAPGTHRSTAVCVDPALNGRLAAELMGKFCLPESQVGIVTGMLTVEDHRLKAQGFIEQFPKFCPGGKVVEVLEGHEDEDETFQKSFDLLRARGNLHGLYVTTVNCLPVCRALGARGDHGKIKLITTDLFKEMSPYFQKGTIFASIYQRPYFQGQTAVRLVVDHLLNGRQLPASYHLNPAIAMRTNLHLFREMRQTETSDGSGPASLS